MYILVRTLRNSRLAFLSLSSAHKTSGMRSGKGVEKGSKVTRFLLKAHRYSLNRRQDFSVLSLAVNRNARTFRFLVLTERIKSIAEKSTASRLSSTSWIEFFPLLSRNFSGLYSCFFFSRVLFLLLVYLSPVSSFIFLPLFPFLVVARKTLFSPRRRL